MMSVEGRLSLNRRIEFWITHCKRVKRRATRRKTPGHEAACSACSAWKAECRRKDGEQHAEKRPAKKLLAVLAVLGKQNAGE